MNKQPPSLKNVLYFPRPERPELLPDERDEPLDRELLPDERETPDERELPPDERDTPEDLDRVGALRPTLPDDLPDDLPEDLTADLVLGAVRLTAGALREELGAVIRVLDDVLRVRLVRPLFLVELPLRLTSPLVRERVEDLFTVPDVREPDRVVEPELRPRVREVLRDTADRVPEPNVVRAVLPELLTVVDRPEFNVLRVVRPTEFLAAVEAPERTMVRLSPSRLMPRSPLVVTPLSLEPRTPPLRRRESLASELRPMVDPRGL